MGRAPDERLRRTVHRALLRRSFCTLATVSPEGAPHVVAVQYAYVDGAVYVQTALGSRKARNVARDPRVAVCVPVRRYPLGPPFAVQFRGTGELLTGDSPEMRRLAADRRLRKIVAHGVLDHPDAGFLRIVPAPRVFTYGLGVPLPTLLRDVQAGSRVLESL